MLTAAAGGQFDVLVVHKLDRFSRSRRVTDEALGQLGQARVGFVSLTENMDWSTPWGQMVLGVLASLAQFYSDNLAQEVRKGKGERKARGLYNGLLPFGVVKSEDGLPIPDRRRLANGSTNYDGLQLAFQAGAEGHSDTEVARLLNARGYRTTGNRGANLWTKDTIHRVLPNRFYLGDLPDGNGGWVPGKHAALLDTDLFTRAQQARARNRTSVATRCATKRASTYSLTGLLWCRCGAKMQFANERGTVRAYCAARKQGLECTQPSVPLRVYEQQVTDWIASLDLPPDAVERALSTAQAEQSPSERDEERRRLEARLAELKDLYAWGDLSRGEYTTERDQIRARLATLEPVHKRRRDLAQLAALVRDVRAVWLGASQEERNRLASRLLTRVTVDEDRVVEIRPRPEFREFLPSWKVSAGCCGSDGIRTRDLSLDRAAC